MNVLATDQEISNRRLWAARAAWLVLAVVGIGMLATSTPGPSLDAPARPLLSLVVFGGIVAAYPALIRVLARSA